MIDFINSIDTFEEAVVAVILILAIAWVLVNIIRRFR